MWEVLSIQTQLMLIERRRDSQKAALRFAADPVNQELSRLGATDLEAVDMAIQLYRGEDLVQNGFIPVEIRPHLEMSLYEFKSFSETNLDRLALEWPTSIQEYLRSRHGGDGSSDSQCKVGFSGLSYSQTGIDRPVKLAVRPLAYWVTQQFNKEIAAHPENAKLQRLRDEFAKTLFRSAEDFNCSCPSSLYLELAVITSDEYIPQLLKQTKHSVFGKRKGDPVATCGVELGFSWKNHIDESSGRPMLNIEKAVYESLQSELQIAVEDIAGWSIGSLAIQHAHLNTAILGVVRLRLTRGELLDRLNRPNKYFHDSPVFLSRKEAILSIQADRGTGKWHQTALMRLQLID